MNLKTWLKGLAAAVIGSASSAASVALADPDHFNFSHSGFILLGKVAAVGGLIALFGYLKQSPLPKDN